MRGQRWIVDILTFFMLGLIFLEVIGFAYLIPQIEQEFHLNLIQVGMLLGVFSAGPGILMGILSGIVTDKLGPRITGIFPLIGLLVVSLGIGFSRTYFDLAVVLIMFGTLQTFSNPIIYKLVGTWLNPKEMGLGSGITNSAQQFFTFCSPIVFYVLLVFFNYNFRLVFLFTAIFSVPLFILWFLFVYDRPEKSPWINLRELKWIYSNQLESGELSEEDLKRFVKNDRSDRISEKRSIAEERIPDFLTFKSMLRDRTSLVLILMCGTMGAVWVSYAIMLPTYLSNFLQYTKQQISWISSVIFLFGFIATIISGIILIRKKKRTVMVMSSSLALIGTVSLSLFSQSTGPFLLILLVSIGFFFATMFYPALYSMTEDYFRKEMLGRVLGVQFTLISIIAALSPYVMTYIASVSAWPYSFVFSTIMALVTITLSLLIPGKYGHFSPTG